VLPDSINTISLSILWEHAERERERERLGSKLPQIGYGLLIPRCYDETSFPSLLRSRVKNTTAGYIARFRRVQNLLLSRAIVTAMRVAFY